MKKEEIIKQLVPGVIVGFVLGFVITLLVGVDTVNPIPNYIGGAVCCLVPTLLNTIIVLKGTAKVLKRKISFGKAVLRTVPLALLSAVMGFLVVTVGVEKIIGISTCEISVIVTAIYEAILGVVLSTLFAYIALKKYVSDVKYTKRK